MQLTIDIPEPLYRELETKSQQSHLSIEELVVGGTQIAVRKARTDGSGPVLGQLNVNFNDFMFMTDDEMELFSRIAALDAEAAIKAFGIRKLDDAA